MQRHATPATYNEAINISPPTLDHFDVRDFAENMKTVRLQMPAFRIGFYQIALLESGGGTVSNNERNFDLDACTLFFNLPEQIVSWAVPQDWKGYYCCLTPEIYTALLDGFAALDDFPFFKDHHPGIHLQHAEALALLRGMERLLKKYQNTEDRWRETRVKAEVTLLLAECLGVFDRYVEEAALRDAGNSLSERFARHVRGEVAKLVLGLRNERLTAAGAAAALFVSPGYLAECTRRDMSMTPTAFINDRLVEEAKKMLATTDEPVVEIARLLSFSSLAYFSRVFKGVTGRSPSAYRNRC